MSSIATRTPGVHVKEISVFPPSVAEVASAIPAFVGYTAKATRKTQGDLHLKPTEVHSLKDFEALFGGPQTLDIAATVTGSVATGLSVSVGAITTKFLLYHAMRAFYDNGGGKCYVVSVGTYAEGTAVTDIALGGSGGNVGLLDGVRTLAQEDEPTLLVVPEGASLAATDYPGLVSAMLDQCAVLQDRFAILDVRSGTSALDGAARAAERALFGTKDLKYGAAYYPFLRTAYRHALANPGAATEGSNVEVTFGSTQESLDKFGTAGESAYNLAVYNAVKAELKEHFITLPPSGAVTGVYVSTDERRGVWKAPANVSLTGVIEPAVKIDDKAQADLNVDDSGGGKSINALRAFAGKGTLVWGARTLAGNDNEWRYVPVRRFFNLVEESIKKSTHWAVFEPNDARTWAKVRGMIEAYLTQKWREGALAGATPDEAFFVRCGLGVTMNSDDILNGRMIVQIGMAVVRPAEFILLEFSHKLQTS